MTEPQKREPLSDPAEIWKLVGRFSTAFMLMVFTLWYIVRRDLPATVFYGLLSIAFQTSALRVRRKLMADRDAAIQARKEATGA